MLPAYAGMIRMHWAAVGRCSSAPRVCGDDPPESTIPSTIGLVLPAYAGMIPPPRSPIPISLSAPRVCGDDPGGESIAEKVVTCSPRMRG